MWKLGENKGENNGISRLTAMLPISSHDYKSSEQCQNNQSLMEKYEQLFMTMKTYMHLLQL